MRTATIALVVAFCGGAAKAQDVHRGKASYYWKPQPVACQGMGSFNPNKLTAAHRSLPCGSKVEVTNPRTRKSVIVTITDRGPNVRTRRDLDLSRAAARVIGLTRVGVMVVSYRVIPTGIASNVPIVPAPAPPDDVWMHDRRFYGCIPIDPC